jgi:hypothetical protein
MRRRKPVSPLLLAVSLIGVIAEPASAQYFGGQTYTMPYKLLLGSAPNPTPDDLCVWGSEEDHCYTNTTRSERRRYIPDPKNRGHFREVRPGDDKLIEGQLNAPLHHEFIPLGAIDR